MMLPIVRPQDIIKVDARIWREGFLALAMKLFILFSQGLHIIVLRGIAVTDNECPPSPSREGS